MIIIRLSFIVLLSLFSLKSKAQKKLTWEVYPDEATTDTAKKSFEKKFKQGIVLYKIGCAKCHAKAEKGKEIIPDFSLPQLMDYEIRIWPQHREQLSDVQITDEELQKIILFLRFKKKSGPPPPPPPLAPSH